MYSLSLTSVALLHTRTKEVLLLKYQNFPLQGELLTEL